MGRHPTGHEIRARQAKAKPSHRVGAVNTDVVEVRVFPKRRRQGESTGKGTAADVHDDGIRWLRAGEELTERRDELLEVPHLVQVGVKQGQVVWRQVSAWGIEVGLTPANGFERSTHVHAEERAAT